MYHIIVSYERRCTARPPGEFIPPREFSETFADLLQVTENRAGAGRLKATVRKKSRGKKREERLVYYGIRRRSDDTRESAFIDTFIREEDERELYNEVLSFSHFVVSRT